MAHRIAAYLSLSPSQREVKRVAARARDAFPLHAHALYAYRRQRATPYLYGDWGYLPLEKV